MQGNIYLIAGGSWDDFDATLKKIIADTKVKNPAVAYLGAASGNNAYFFQSVRTALLNAGAANVTAIDFKDKEKNLNQLGQSPIIFVSGGDVEKGMKALADSGGTVILKTAFDRGAHFIGVSAGAIMLCKQWVAWRDKRAASAYLFDCLGFADIYCDAHDEPRWQELKTLLRLLNDKKAKGLGLRSGSAIKVIGTGYKLLAGEVDEI